MTISEKDNLEYFLLRNYKVMSLITRGILLRADLEAIEKIQKNEWFVKFEEAELEKSKRMTIGMVQADIIAKMMMYVEDFAIISEGLLRETSYYELLDQKINPNTKEEEDIGKIIKSFFEKIDNLSENDLQKILSYGEPEDYTKDLTELELLKKSLAKELEEFKRVVQLISNFGKEHHPYFRRYKHAGFPFNPGLPIIQPLPDYAKQFDFISIVYVNKNPFEEPKIIPYSDKVKESYHIIIHGLQQRLQDLVTNRMAFIQRGKKIPPIPWRSAPYFTPEEMKILDKILSQYNKDNPPVNTEFKINYQIRNLDSWYAHLDEFIKTCSKTKQMDEEFAKKTNYKYLDEKDKQNFKK